MRLVPLASLLVLATPLAADVVIPSSAFASGRGNALFQSDVRVFNPTSSTVTVTPVFYDQSNGETVTKAAFTVPSRQQVAFDNVLQSLFGRGQGSFGPIRFQTSAAIVVSSSVNNVNGCGTGATSGQWLPGVDVAKALKAGTLVNLAASGDSASGYRSNIDFVNVDPAGSATITVKVRKGNGTLLSSTTLPPLAPNALFQKAIDDGGTFPGVAGTTDTNLWLEFTSDRPVIAFSSVINNGSGDPYAIVMTEEPTTTTPPAAPVVDFDVSASPKVGTAVTFTDKSTNSPTQQLWVFGDGTTATSGTTAQKTYATAGTYKVSHFASNAGGVGVATKDVVVSAAVVEVNVTLKQFEFQPASVTLDVGTTYKVTYSSIDVEHGVGGLTLLGISCPSVTKTTPCSTTITPKASQVGTYTPTCLVTCGAGHPNMRGTLIVRQP